MKDWRRINVAFTRARSKLIVFGSRGTLRQVPVLAEFLDLMQKKGWILGLPPNSDQFHPLAIDEKPSSNLKRGATESPVKKKSPGNARSISPVKGREPKRAKLESHGQQGLLKSRHILGDIYKQQSSITVA